MFGNYEAVMKAHQLCFFLPLVIWLTSAFWTQLLRSNSLLVLQHADRKFLSLTRCEPNETYWHPRVMIWGQYVARCGNTASLVSSSFCSSFIGQWSLGPHVSAPTELTDLPQDNLSIITLCTFCASYCMWLLKHWN